MAQIHNFVQPRPAKAGGLTLCWAEQQGGLMEEPSDTQRNVVVAKPWKGWLYITGIIAIGGYAAVLIPAFSGQSIKPELGYGLMFWSGLFFYYWWKVRGRKGWHGGFVGALFGLLVFMAAAFIVGYVRAKAGG